MARKRQELDGDLSPAAISQDAEDIMRADSADTPKPRRKATRASLLEKYKDFPGIKVIARRLNDPDSSDGVDIRLNDEPSHSEDPKGTRRLWYVRWINTDNHGRWHKVMNVLGFVPVRMSELQNAEEVAGLAKSEDGLVRMGDRGKEVLVKQPLELYNDRKSSEQERRQRRAINARLVKEELANLAGSKLGSEAGDTIHSEFSVEYAPQRRSTIGDEIADRA